MRGGPDREEYQVPLQARNQTVASVFHNPMVQFNQGRQMEDHLPKLMARGRSVLLVLIIVGTGFKLNSFSQAAVPQAEIALRPYMGPLKSIQVAVGKETLPFILDTGGGFTIITPEVARKTGCIPVRRQNSMR
jgi:hypothetical protein